MSIILHDLILHQNKLLGIAHFNFFVLKEVIRHLILYDLPQLYFVKLLLKLFFKTCNLLTFKFNFLIKAEFLVLKLIFVLEKLMIFLF